MSDIHPTLDADRKKSLPLPTLAVEKRWLFLLAGLMWSGAGVMLLRLASGWLTPVDFGFAVILASGGLLLCLMIYRFGFSKFADKNIQRIKAYTSNQVCIFAFQGWTSYPLVAFMISLGVALRKYSPIPKPLLACAYIGIGGSLLLASLRYYRCIFNHRQ